MFRYIIESSATWLKHGGSNSTRFTMVHQWVTGTFSKLPMLMIGTILNFWPWHSSSCSQILNIKTIRKPSIEAGIRRNAICYSTWNEIWTLEIQSYHCTTAILSAILKFVIRFVSNFYNWCPVSLRTVQWKNEVSTLINGWVTANYSVSRPPFCPPSWNLLSDLCQTSTTHVRCHYAQFSEKT